MDPLEVLLYFVVYDAGVGTCLLIFYVVMFVKYGQLLNIGAALKRRREARKDKK